jgi:predicted phosphodiesterase
VSDVRYLILSDIHANIDALEAVLTAAATWDRVLVLGDLVGYGAAPKRRHRPRPRARARDGDSRQSRQGGVRAGRRLQLQPGGQVCRRVDAPAAHGENREYLRQLPHGPIEIDARMEVCHGAPFDEDHYIFDGIDAQRALDTSARQVCLFGHTHLPVVFMAKASALAADIPDDELPTMAFEEGTRYLINPGSVGQPRDGDAPRRLCVLRDQRPDGFRARRVRTSPRPRSGFQRRGFLKVLRIGSRLGGDRRADLAPLQPAGSVNSIAQF